jgi:hypothetical protein
MDVVVLNEESNMPDREKQFLSGKNHYATYTTCSKTPRESEYKWKYEGGEKVRTF